MSTRHVLLAAFAAGLFAYPAVAADKFAGVDLSPTKVGPQSDLQDISKYCGTKPMKVALSDGFGNNSWRKITRAEFENEAKKCPNITEIKYTDAQGNVQKQLADIQGLAAQGFDVILVYPDGGPAVIKAMQKATEAGAAVVPYMVGTAFPGERGKDYLLVATESVEAKARAKAQWVADRLNGKGNIVVLGGTPGNPTSLAEMTGWKEVWDKYPDIKVLEGPVDTNWDPAESQKVMAGLLAKYDKIDAVYSDYGLGAMGALRAYTAAGRKIPLWVTEDANEVACYWLDNKDANPDFQLATIPSRMWIVRLALRKAVAAVQGINNDEPTVVELSLAEESQSTDPKLAPRCDKSLPPDAILSSQLSMDELKALFAK
ncbi:MAG: substrate-binding domain-containing protein [Bauldia sp.]